MEPPPEEGEKGFQQGNFADDSEKNQEQDGEDEETRSDATFQDSEEEEMTMEEYKRRLEHASNATKKRLRDAKVTWRDEFLNSVMKRFMMKNENKLAHEDEGEKRMIPPTQSKKALELLVRSKSLMGVVNEELGNDTEFRVPGQEDYAYLDSSMGNMNASSTNEKSSSLELRSVREVEEGNENPMKEKRCCRTVHFRGALVLLLTVLVLLSCIVIATIALTLAANLTNESVEQCDENVEALTHRVSSLILQLGLRDAATTLLLLREEFQLRILAVPFTATGRILNSMKFGHGITSDFTGMMNVSNEISLEASYQSSIGPVLASSLDFKDTAYIRLLFTGWGNEEVLIQTVDRFRGFECFEACLPSPNCTSFPLFAESRRPDFSGSPVPQCMRGLRRTFTEHPVFMRTQARLDSGRIPGIIWNPNSLSNRDGLVLTLTRPHEFCLDANCSQTLIGADVDTAGISCLLYELLLSRRQNLASEGLPWGNSEKSVMYVIFNGANNETTFSGSITASSDACKEPNPFIGNFTSAAEYLSERNLVSFSARYVRDNWFNGSFTFEDCANVVFENRTELVHFEDGRVCDLQRESRESLIRDCFFISAVTMCSSSMDPMNITSIVENHVLFTGVSVYPFSIYYLGIEEEVGIQQKNATELRKQRDKEYWDAFLVITGSIIGVIVLVCLIGVLISLRFGRSVIQLSGHMKDLGNMKISKIEPSNFSRIDEISQMQRTYNEMCASIQVMAKFVPDSVVRSVIQNPDGKRRRLHVVRKNVTILFSDIANFTSISEALPEKELLYFLTKYLTVMTACVESYGGVVAEILGDGILAFWNTPDNISNHQARACASALAQQQSMGHLNARFNKILERIGKPSFSIRVGLHTGTVLTGNIGSKTKMKFGCIGDAVNLASRMEGINKLYGTGILISESCYQGLPQETFVTRELDLVAVKGKNKPVRIFELLAMKTKISEPRICDESSLDASRLMKTKPWPKFKFSSLSKVRLNSSNNRNEDSGASQSEEEFMVYGPVQKLNSPLMEVINLYEASLRLYQQGHFQQALHIFLTSKIPFDDQAAEFLKTRIAAALKKYGQSIADDPEQLLIWQNGVLKLDSKEF